MRSTFLVSGLAAKPIAIQLAIQAAVVVCCAAVASAQAVEDPDPDIRNLQPAVMLVVDTSGSMERLPSCSCVTDGCLECLPDCSLSNTLVPSTDPQIGITPTKAAPQDGSLQIEAKKNRWAITLEALTGRFYNYECNPLQRVASNGMTYDVSYFLPYHQPWDCPTGDVCAYPGTQASPLQADNGLLDTYASTFRFGLMTFDGYDTYVGGVPLIAESAFNIPLSESQSGMWSYGEPKTFRYPTCLHTYMMDTGARSPTASEGGLISINSNNCSDPPCDIYEINTSIQDALLRARPYGGTPIAAALDDLYYHYKNDLSDSFAACRKRIAVLITDGKPDGDYRDYDCDCYEGGTPEANNCPADEQHVAHLMHCPYPRPEQVAYDLKNGRTTSTTSDPAMLDELFVVGISISDDAEAKTKLNLIAERGGATADANGNYARFADDLDVLAAELDILLSSAAETLSRTLPVFATGALGMQYQISTGLHMATGRPIDGIAPPRRGLIERHRLLCDDGAEVPEPDELDPLQGDTFHDVLNGGTPLHRYLFTVMPTGATSAIMRGHLRRATPDAECALPYCPHVQLDDELIDPTLFGLGSTDTATRTLVTDWMYGEPGSVRANARLGDIFHSSPAIIGPPRADTSPDEAYAPFVERPEVATRPLTLFVGSNDGILHAFAVEAYAGTAENGHLTENFAAGEELWGFVPPYFINELKDQLPAHQYGMDATPVVKDVFFQRTPDDPGEYRTVLIAGMRGGGNAYVALDVTDPIEPQFLWQFTDPEMGLTYGQAAIGQVNVWWDNGGTAELQQRAVAILPGGLGTKGDGPGCENGTTRAMVNTATAERFESYRNPVVDTSTAILHRQSVECWNAKGRALYFVDVETGTLIKKIDATSTAGEFFPSPLTGTPVLYPDAVGAISTEGFVIDADGVLWRIDLNDPDPHAAALDTANALQGWTARPFHDLFWGMQPGDGETWYERPILSLDDQSRLVIIAGTGDISNFDRPTVTNRVVSLTEFNSTVPPTAPEHYNAGVNWEHRQGNDPHDLMVSEFLAGSMALFQGQLFYSTFASVVNQNNPCNNGRGRLWSVDYVGRGSANSDGGGATHRPLLRPVLRSNPLEENVFWNLPQNEMRDNFLVNGLATSQRSCIPPEEVDVSTYYSGHLPGFTPRTQPPSIWVSGQLKDGSPLTNSALGSISEQLQRPRTFTRVTGWAASVD